LKWRQWSAEVTLFLGGHVGDVARHPDPGRSREPGGVGLDLTADPKGVLRNGDAGLVQDAVSGLEPRSGVMQAASSGVTAAAAINADLTAEDIARAVAATRLRQGNALVAGRPST
jgi:hypothetical protein